MRLPGNAPRHGYSGERAVIMPTMFIRLGNRILILCLGLGLFAIPLANAAAVPSWKGTLSDASGKPVAGAFIALHSVSHGQDHDITTGPGGEFSLTDLAAGSYTL